MDYIEQRVNETARLHIERTHLENERALFVLVCQGTGRSVEVKYAGREAVSLSEWLDTLDCSQVPRHRQLLERFVADGKIAGTVKESEDEAVGTAAE